MGWISHSVSYLWYHTQMASSAVLTIRRRLQCPVYQCWLVRGPRPWWPPPQWSLFTGAENWCHHTFHQVIQTLTWTQILCIPVQILMNIWKWRWVQGIHLQSVGELSCIPAWCVMKWFILAWPWKGTWSQDTLCSTPMTVWSVMGPSITLESWVVTMRTSTLTLRWAVTTVTIAWSLTRRWGCMWGFTPEASGVISVKGHSLVLQHCRYMTSCIVLRGTPWTATNVTRCMPQPWPWEFKCKASMDQALFVETVSNVLIHQLSWRGMQPNVTHEIVNSLYSTQRCLVFVISCEQFLSWFQVAYESKAVL